MMMPLLLLSAFLATPAPLDMPRAEAYLVADGNRQWLEDRYSRLDLWTSQAVDGRWTDGDGRVFILASLGFAPPPESAASTLTRTAYAEQRAPMPRLRANREIPVDFRRAVQLLADCALTEERPRPARQLPHGYAEVSYWHHATNETSIVCAFRRERSEQWNLAVWHLAAGDDRQARMAEMEDVFLRNLYPEFARRQNAGRPAEPPATEREWLRRDARHSVSAYGEWRTTESEEFTLLDNALTSAQAAAVTNEFAEIRRRAAAVLPTPVDGTNVLCVARVYASRAEYLAALAADGMTNMVWSAAYWSPLRRELVAYLPETDEAGFLRTVRHETFHQYLSYASSMIPVSPWLNEGYAQYFEDPDSEDWGLPVDLGDDGLKRLAALLPPLLDMDYGGFYAGTDGERRLKYRLAWSLAVFLEKGADEVRFRPFAGLKRRYFDSLLKNGDMRRATADAFGSEDNLRLFAAEWIRFWRER